MKFLFLSLCHFLVEIHFASRGMHDINWFRQSSRDHSRYGVKNPELTGFSRTSAWLIIVHDLLWATPAVKLGHQHRRLYNVYERPVGIMSTVATEHPSWKWQAWVLIQSPDWALSLVCNPVFFCSYRSSRNANHPVCLELTIFLALRSAQSRHLWV